MPNFNWTTPDFNGFQAAALRDQASHQWLQAWAIAETVEEARHWVRVFWTGTPLVDSFYGFTFEGLGTGDLHTNARV